MDELKPRARRAPVPLNQDQLSDLPDHVQHPTYDRSRLTAGIVHIGVGNFHRAHQAWYLHRLMQAGEAMDWGIIGASVREQDGPLRSRLQAQSYLTSLIELAPEASAVEVIGPMIDYLPIEPNNAALIQQLAAPDIRIVSLTVTEGGYFTDPATKGFDAAHPDIQHDARHPDQPRTAFGAMIAALRLRRTAGSGPFTCMSCDNLLGNGNVLRQTLVSLARLSDPDLADWIDTQCSFPNAMVDCIVPATGPNELALAGQLGIADQAPVTHESFRQWVIEDDFCAGRPDWDKVGVTFTDKVHLFEAMKIRILNGGHQVLSVPAQILGVETISEAMSHPLIGPFFEKVARSEIAPHVANVPGMTAEAYVALIADRFRNPKIVDTTRRVAFDGSARHPGFILPSIRDGLAAGGEVQGLALAAALWARMCAGHREDGQEIVPNDPQWEILKRTAKQAKEDPLRWLGMEPVYGGLAAHTAFAALFSQWLSRIWADGVEAALQSYLAD